MAFKKNWHVILTNAEGTNVVNTSFSKYSGYLVLGLIGVLAVIVAGTMMFIFRWHRHFPQIEQVRAENRILRTELDRLAAEMDTITCRLKQMQEWEDNLRLDRNMETINRDILKMGTGGLPQVEVSYSELDKEANLRLNILWMNVRELNGMSSFAHKVREELVANISLQEEMYRYTPSIYPAFGRISSPYGWRTHPITGKRDFHSGIDISNVINSPVYVTADGVVREIGFNRFYGRYLVVTHKFGYQTMYAHLHRTNVKRGDEVKRGDIVANLGNTGRSTGPHLHYEIRKFRKTVNPYPYLNKMENEIIITGG